MAKNSSTFTIKGVLDLTNMENGIKNLQKQVANANLGKAFSSSASKELDKIASKMAKLFNNVPGSSASSKQIEKFSNELSNLYGDLSDFSRALEKFNITDDYILKNVDSVIKLSNELKKLSAAGVKAEESISKISFHEPDPNSRSKVLITDTQAKMRKAARNQDSDFLEKTFSSTKGILNTKLDSAIKSGNTGQAEALKKEIDALGQEYETLKTIIKEMNSIREQELTIQERLKTALDMERTSIRSNANGIISSTNSISVSINNAKQKIEEYQKQVKKLEESKQNFEHFSNSIKQVFSATSVYYAMQRVIRNAVEDFKELDQQFNEIAIVSDYSTKEMWESFSTVNKTAQEFGVTTKNVLEVQNLYYHQGKDMTEVNKLTAQTLTLAKITGLDYERATSELTAALNAYNIAAEDAVEVTDSIAALDANAAISSEELMTALTKTASIAANAGMSLQSTEVFLTKMIETTREAPENLGTALKTIIARFGEVKQQVDGEDIELIDINRVDTALKTIGISLLDTAGQIRDLDDVFYELSAKWDGLDRNTQRYIATIAAGSRQQSRFIAMLEDYDRTLELTDIAQNSAGTGADQLAKSMESIESSINKLKSSWQEFYSYFISNDMIKGIVDLGNTILSVLNYLAGIDYIGKPLASIISLFSLWAIKTQVIDKGLAKMKEGLGDIISNSITSSENKRKEEIGTSAQSLLDAEKEGTITLSEDERQLYREQALELEKQNALLREKNKLILNNVKSENLEGSEKAEIDQIREINETDPKKARQMLKNKGLANKGGFVENIQLKDFKQRVRNSDLGEEYSDELINLAEESLPLAQEKASEKLKNSPQSIKDSIKQAKEKSFQENILKEGISLEDAQKIRGQKLFAENATGKDKIKTLFKNNFVDVPKALAGKGENAAGGIKNIGASIKGLATDKIGGLLGKLSAGFTSLASGLQISTAALGAFLGPLLGVVAAIGVAIAIYKIWQKTVLDNTKAVERQKKAQDAYNESLNNYKQLEKNAEIVEKYRAKGVLTEDEQQENQDAIKSIVEDYPALLDYIDEEGNYHIKNAAAIQEELDLKRQLVKETSAQLVDIKKENVDNRIYADTTTRAGQAMENLKSFAASLDEDTMKDIGKEIDSGRAFNKSHFYDMMEAYASGEKTSFSKSDFSTLFEGDISDSQWSELLEIVDENPEILKNEKELADTLHDIGAMNEQNAKQAAESFIAMDEATGHMFSTIMESAEEAKESVTIEATEAYISTQRWGTKLTEGFSKAVATYIATNERTKNFSEEVQQEEVDKIINSAISSMTTSQFENFQKDITNTGSLTKEDVEGGDYDVLIEDLNLDSDLPKEVEDFLISLVKDVDESFKKYEENEEYLFKQRDSNGINVFSDQDAVKKWLKTLTLDQRSILSTRQADLGDFGGAQYLKGLYELSDKVQGRKDAQDILNSYLGIVPGDIDSINKGLLELSRKGIDTTAILQNMVDAAGSISGISYQDTTTEVEDLNAAAEEATETFKGLFTTGGNLSQLNSFLSKLIEVPELLSNAGATFQDVINSVNVDANGFTLGDQFTSLGQTSSLEFLKRISESAIATSKGYIEEIQANTSLSPEERTAQTNEEILKANLAAWSYQQTSAQIQQELIDENNEKLQEQLDKLEGIRDAWKDYVDWLREWDRYKNLDELIESYDRDQDHLEYELEFSTNTDVLEEDIKTSFNNVNNQIAANQAGVVKANEEMREYRDLISSRNSQYVSFDVKGNAILKAEELQKLQKQILNADEEQREVLQAQYDEIIDNVDAYSEAKDKAEDYSKALEEAFKELSELLKENYESITKIEDKLIEVRQEAEDRELEAVKEKYDAIKDENDKYLEDVQDMVDKEREIRDREENEEDIKTKERRLAMMKMDTSGVYTSEIKALEEELKDDYKSLSDDTVDKMLEDLEEQFDVQAEQLDKEVEYLENALTYKREKTTEYQQWANAMLMQSSDTVIAYLKQNDQEYYQGTSAAQALWVLEWEQAVSRGQAANNAMNQTLIPVMNTLQLCQNNAYGFEGAVKQYGQTAVVSNNGVKTTVSNLNSEYQRLVGTVENDMPRALGELQAAYQNAAVQAERLADAQSIIATGERLDIDDIPAVKPPTSGYSEPNNSGFQAVAAGSDTVQDIYSGALDFTENERNSRRIYTSDGTAYIRTNKTYKGEYLYLKETDYTRNTSHGKKGPKWNSQFYFIKKYASGGYVDYTGPAWVDGTKNKPEYMLNARQTLQFENLISALDILTNNNSLSSIKDNSIPKSVQYNLSINVDQISSDYDVDQMVERIEKKILDASKSRNINILKKSN